MSEKNISNRNAIVLLPILVIGTFSFGYLSFNSIQKPDRPTVESTTTPANTGNGPDTIDGVQRPQVPTLAPLETPADTSSPAVTPGGNPADANAQTGATESLQGNGAKAANPNSAINQKLQAPDNSLKLQTRRGLLFP